MKIYLPSLPLYEKAYWLAKWKCMGRMAFYFASGRTISAWAAGLRSAVSVCGGGLRSNAPMHQVADFLSKQARTKCLLL
jgi:hypothetical protein